MCLTLLLISAAMFGTVGEHSLTMDSGYITGHLVHNNVSHLMMNLTGLWLVTIILNNSTINQLHLWVVTLLSIVAISFAVTNHYTVDNTYYVGYSGVLYGICTFLLLTNHKNYTVECVLVVCYVLWTKQVDYQSPIAELIQVRVANEAHLVGACVGVMYAAILNIISRLLLSSSPNCG
jgi:membrane associated rhomboid family serine protease